LFFVAASIVAAVLLARPSAIRDAQELRDL
jgi:hypothetical protein